MSKKSVTPIFHHYLKEYACQIYSEKINKKIHTYKSL